ncbi:MAG: hypothetical protein LHW64_06235 [Candidatus Cloacimonetes bacterium]|jgi:hypothetical protein|nr:hypothetical protein [Candidatus Cloacimonadota bacterium]MDY0229704.1 hypothetical protein [Candidatus Cloacimonadaceae bacterium]
MIKTPKRGRKKKTDRKNTKNESCRDEISDKKPRPGHNQALIKNGGMPEGHRP